jgi:hypothetical protein
MYKWLDYTLEVNGKKYDHPFQAISPEAVVRREMNWFRFGAVFTVTDENGKISKFRKIKTSDAVTGYADIEKIL